MKTPIFITLGCLITCLAYAAAPPPDFADVPWGASRDEARRILTQRGAQFESNPSNGKVLIFTGGKFAGQQAVHWALQFEGGEFNEAKVTLKGEGKAETRYRRMVTLLSGKYGSANEKQVAHRLPPHFVFGLGWRNSGASKPPMHADWLAESALTGRSMAISCWVDGGAVLVQYQHHTSKSTSGTLAPIKKSRPEDDL